MWVRSQKKRSFIETTGKIFFIREHQGQIIESISNIGIGTYNSEKRAIEVLNELQNEIMNNYQPNKVFEMPEN